MTDLLQPRSDRDRGGGRGRWTPVAGKTGRPPRTRTAGSRFASGSPRGSGWAATTQAMPGLQGPLPLPRLPRFHVPAIANRPVSRSRPSPTPDWLSSRTRILVDEPRQDPFRRPRRQPGRPGRPKGARAERAAPPGGRPEADDRLYQDLMTRRSAAARRDRCGAGRRRAREPRPKTPRSRRCFTPAVQRSPPAIGGERPVRPAMTGPRRIGAKQFGTRAWKVRAVPYDPCATHERPCAAHPVRAS